VAKLPFAMSRKRKIILALAVLAVFTPIWLMANPPGRFGLCCFSYSTYNAFPRPVVDFQVRSDGKTRMVRKTHDLTFDRIEWLLEPMPETLIIATGWDGVTRPDYKILHYKGCELLILKNKEGIERFNELKKAGKRVAIHYHSTC
jgi:hypothetical protein